ncbi:MAG TPA: hypothetical protein VHX14_21600 [Thermoanaerobaculia bacterium]|jgi:hypothetical protein|nr:hypothetical protein [Thermoanaerobaculia bacterium]
MIAEPMTAFTDLLLCLLSLTFAIRWRGGTSRTRSLWSLAFLATGLGSLTGGVYHAFQTTLPPLPLAILWKITATTIGAAGLLLFCGTIQALVPQRVARLLTIAASLLFMIYLVWMATHNEFIYVIAFYGFLMVAMLVICIARYRIAPRSCGLIISGIAIAAIAVAVQASHIRLFAHFNHNDLYHVIQMISLFVLYRGAREMP